MIYFNHIRINIHHDILNLISLGVYMADDKYIGDHIEAALKAIGGERITKTIENATGKPCGCANRKRIMNDAHKRVLRMIGLDTTVKDDNNEGSNNKTVDNINDNEQ